MADLICFDCEKVIEGSFQRCPIDKIPRRKKVVSTSLCGIKYDYKQNVTELEVDHRQNFFPEEIRYLSETFEPLSKGRRIIFCSMPCIENFVRKNYREYILTRSGPILWSMKKPQKQLNNENLYMNV